MITPPDAEEHVKIALIVDQIRASGNHAIVIDAVVLRDRLVQLRRNGLNWELIPSPEVVVCAASRFTGHHRDRDGTRHSLTVADVGLLTSTERLTQLRKAPDIKIGPHQALPGSVPIDAAWIEAIDNDQRLRYQHLYDQIHHERIPSLAGTWDSVLATSFKHRTHAVLSRASAEGGHHLPVPRTDIVRDLSLQAIDQLMRHHDRHGGVWVKPPNDGHGRGVQLAFTREDIVAACRNALRPTPDGDLCLIQEDVCSIATDAAGRRLRADTSLVVLDQEVLSATLRLQSDLRLPSNSLHGGTSYSVPPETVSPQIRTLAVAAIAAVGRRYGSVDIFGGPLPTSHWHTIQTPPPVIGEINMMPGGRAPGYLTSVVQPLTRAHIAEVVLQRD